MRRISVVAAYILSTIAFASVDAQEGGIINPGGNTNNLPVIDVSNSILQQINRVPPRHAMPFTIEGLPKEARGERLTWERAYALAIVRSREKGESLAPTLDPKALDERAAKVAFADFARFRREFLAGAASFRDPSNSYFDLLARSQTIEHARACLAALEKLLNLYQELVKGESSRVTQLHVDKLNLSLQQARLDLLEHRSRYRDALDVFKVELGLAPRAPVELDQTPLSRFVAAFDDLTRWTADPSRELQRLDELVLSLPKLGDLIVANRSLLESSVQTFDTEQFVAASGELVSKRGPSAETEVRKLTRRLTELAIAYRIEMKHLVLITRVRSTAQEELIAPLVAPRPVLGGAFDPASLAGIQDQLRQSEDHLVETWTAYHSLRLTLSRHLGLLPVENWSAFFDQMTAGKDDPERAKRVPAVTVPAQVPPAAPAAPDVVIPPPPRPSERQ
jgi:hypothetical protein